jgi:Lysozyme like domain
VSHRRDNHRDGDADWVLVIGLVVLALGAKPAADAAPPPHHHRTARPPAPLAKEATPPLVLPGSAARLAPERIYAYARGAGFSPDESVMATAIALAESGGRPRAHNPIPPDDSYCLLQVNMLGPLGPERRARYRLRANSDPYDPATCLRVAYGISAGGSDWRPWTTYTRGAYQRFLPTARHAKGGRR